MKIKVDLAAFEALTQEQMLAIAASEMNCHPDAIENVRMSDGSDSTGYATLRWWMKMTKGYGYLEVTGEIVSSVSGPHVIGAGRVLRTAMNVVPIRWATIEKLAEYNVITFQP